jgi:hypothetical protein
MSSRKSYSFFFVIFPVFPYSLLLVIFKASSKNIFLPALADNTLRDFQQGIPPECTLYLCIIYIISSSAIVFGSSSKILTVEKFSKNLTILRKR